MSLWGNSDADEAKPKWLTAAEKKLTFADARGWVFKKSDNHPEEVLCAIGELATSIGKADITHITWVSTAFDKSDGGTLSATVTFNEKGYSFKNCLFKLNKEGDVLMNYLYLPMSSPIMQKIGFLFCVDRGVKLGGNPETRKKAFEFSKFFMRKTLIEN